MKHRIRLLLFLVLGSIVAAQLLAAPVIARPLAQEQTPYDYPTYDIPTGYPDIGQTPYVDPGQSSPTPPNGDGTPPIPGASPTVGTLNPGFDLTPTSLETLMTTPTRRRNLFGTEDAEMSSARVTPPASETPLPSQTTTPTITIPTTMDESAAFNFERGWFAAGILLPLFILFCLWLVYRARRSGEFG
jgi:hypothetical protein